MNISHHNQFIIVSQLWAGITDTEHFQLRKNFSYLWSSPLARIFQESVKKIWRLKLFSEFSGDPFNTLKNQSFWNVDGSWWQFCFSIDLRPAAIVSLLVSNLFGTFCRSSEGWIRSLIKLQFRLTVLIQTKRKITSLVTQWSQHTQHLQTWSMLQLSVKYTVESLGLKIAYRSNKILETLTTKSTVLYTFSMRK